jgi:hypothetical protein
MDMPKYINYSEGILVAGLARNCENSIHRDVLKINKALANFTNISWLVIESDSEDSTLNSLKDLQRKVQGFDFYTFGRLQGKLPLRTERIAYCRNKYLEELEDNSKYQDIKYLVVADLDGINDKLTQDGFESCWSRDNWNVCTANQSAPYYDIWALRHPIWNPGDCRQVKNFYKDCGLSEYCAFLYAVSSKMITIQSNSDWIKVDSAFGGLGIYKKDVIRLSRYVGIDKTGREVCEHVSFHKSLKINQSANIYINPQLVNSEYTQHTRHLMPIIGRLFKLRIFIIQFLKK